jgi:hypothetical protein
VNLLDIAALERLERAPGEERADVPREVRPDGLEVRRLAPERLEPLDEPPPDLLDGDGLMQGRRQAERVDAAAQLRLALGSRGPDARAG